MDIANYFESYTPAVRKKIADRVSYRRIWLPLCLSVFILISGCGGGAAGNNSASEPFDNEAQGTEQSTSGVTNMDENEATQNDDVFDQLPPVSDVVPDEPAPLPEVSADSNSGLVVTGVTSALEGSVVKFSVSIAGVEPSDLTKFVVFWFASGTTTGNTRGSISGENSSVLSVELPLVDLDTALEYSVEVDYRLAGDTSDRALVRTISINVIDGLPSEALVVAATGREAPGIPDSRLTTIGESVLADSGAIAFSGEFRDASNRIGQGLWTGTAESMQLLVKTGDTIPGLAVNSTFESVSSLSISPDGEIGAIITLAGAGSGSAALITANGQPQVILQTGSRVRFSGISAPVVNISAVERTIRGAYLQTSPDVRGEDLWDWTEAGFQPVALSIESAATVIPSGATVTDIEALPFPFTRDGCFFVRNDPPVVSQVGEIAFTAQIYPVEFFTPLGIATANFDDSRCQRNFQLRKSVFRFGASGLSDVVVVPEQSGSESSFVFVPLRGMEGKGYSVENVVHLYNNGEVVFLADIGSAFDGTVETLESSEALLRTASPDTLDLSLIAMKEELLPPDFTQRIDRLVQDFLFANATNQVGFVTRHSTGLAIYAGEGHVAQPYSSLESVGSSNLRYVIGESAASPDGFDSTTFFDSFGVPVMDSQGNVRIFSKIDGPSDDRDELDAFWVAGNDGSVTLRTAGYAPVQAGSRQIRLTKPDIFFSENVPTGTDARRNELLTTGEGDLLFKGSVDDVLFSGFSQALIYLPVNRP